MMLNPFSGYAAPVTPENFCGRKKIISGILDRVAHDAASAVVGEQRIGKTSLLQYLQSPQAGQAFPFLDKTFIFVFINCQALPAISPRNFWYELLSGLEMRAHDPVILEPLGALLQEYRQNTDAQYYPLAQLRRFFERVHQWQYRVIFLMDEFDCILESHELPISFYNNLRALVVDKMFNFILVTRRNLAATAPEVESGSPFFNVFIQKEMVGFTDKEVTLWMDTRLKGSSVTFSVSDRALVRDLGGRHPFFSEMAAYFLYDIREEDPDLPTAEVRRQVEREVKKEANGQFSSYWKHSGEEEMVMLALLALRRKDRPLDPAMFASKCMDQLERRALILQEEAGWKIFSPLFEQFVRDEFYSRISLAPGTFDDFIEKYEADQPKEKIKRMAAGAKSALLQVNAKYWMALIRVLMNRENPDQILTTILDTMAKP